MRLPNLRYSRVSTTPCRVHTSKSAEECASVPPVRKKGTRLGGRQPKHLKARRARGKGGKHSNKKSKRKEKRSTGPSRVVPHRSTTPARTCLTSLFGWEAVSQADMAALEAEPKNQPLLPSHIYLLTPPPYSAGTRKFTYLRPQATRGTYWRIRT